MYEKFLSKFKEEKRSGETPASSLVFHVHATGLDEFFGNFSGCLFNGGLYRIHPVQDLSKWNQYVSEAFPDFSERIFCFGCDWLGRQFALDNGRVEAEEPLILMLEPGSGDALEIPANFLQFHEDVLVNQSNDALAVDFFNEWISAGNALPKNNQCVGYKTPLFLGGSDTIENLEPTDLEVYWSICGQLLAKVRGFPPGTPIKNVFIE
jgi:hypothetical protein